MHDLYLDFVNITWEGPDVDIAALEQALKTGKTRGAALVLEYRNKVMGEIDFNFHKMTDSEGEEWPYPYFRRLQSDFPGITFVFDIVFSGVAGGCDGIGRYFSISRAGERLYNASNWLERPGYAESWALKKMFAKSEFIEERGGKAWLKEIGSETDNPSWYELLKGCRFNGAETIWEEFAADHERASRQMRNCGYEHYCKLRDKGRLPGFFAKHPFGDNWDDPEECR